MIHPRLRILEYLEWYEAKFVLYNNYLELDFCLGSKSFELIEDVGSRGRDRTADLGVMNPEFATAHNAFQSKNQHFQRRDSRLSRT